MKRKRELMILGMLSIFIIITIIITFNVMNRIEFQSIENDYVYFLDGSLADTLSNMYEDNPYEYSACVNGNFQGDAMKEVYFLDIDNINQGTENKVELVLCDSIAVIHSHPNGVCVGKLNAPDVEAAKVEFRNGVSFFVIQCSEDTFEVYGRNNLYEGVTIEI